MKHVGEYNGQMYWILGHNAKEGCFLLLDPKRLDPKISEQLYELFTSNWAQTINDAQRILSRDNHISGANLWMWCVQQAMSSRLPIKDVRVGDREQCIYWLGDASRYDPEVNNLLTGRYSNERRTPIDPPIPDSQAQDLKETRTNRAQERLATAMASKINKSPGANAAQDQRLTTLESTVLGMSSQLLTLTQAVSSLAGAIANKGAPKKKWTKKPSAVPKVSTSSETSDT